MGEGIFAALAISLGMTLVLELGFCCALKIRGWHDLLLVVLANTLTNPAVVLLHALMMNAGCAPEWTVVLPLELAAVLAEGLCYKLAAKKIKRPFLFSLGANAFSYAIGLVISTFF